MRRRESVKKAGRALTVVAIAAAVLCYPVRASADVVLDWNAIALSVAGDAEPVQSGAHPGHHAVGGFRGRQRNHRQVRTLSRHRGRAGRRIGEAAAVAAAHGVLKSYFPAPASVAFLDAARASLARRDSQTARPKPAASPPAKRPPPP